MSKKKRVMLLYPKWTEDYGLFAHFVNRSSSWPPLNLAYLASMAELKGFETRIIDGQANNVDLENMIKETLDFDPGIIGVTTTTPFHHIAEKLMARIKKETDAITVIGGPHITVTPDEPRSFTRAFDYGFIGQADKSWADFLERYDSGKPLHDGSGLIFRDGDNIIYTGPAPKVDLKDVPHPARHLLVSENYTIGTLQGIKQFTTIKSVRGCPFKCTFCSTDVFGYKLKKDNPESTLEEIQKVIETQKTRHFAFLDDTLTADKKHISDLCDLIIKNNLGITFEGGTRANLVSEPLMEKMAEAGLIRISFGLETADDNIRKIMKKEVSLESHEEANRFANKYGVEALNSCIMGMPGETKETVRKTLRYLRLTPEIKQVNISIAVPYPGTELARQAKNGEYGLKLLTDDFRDYRRYNAAVMQVGDLMPEDLIKLQNDAYLSIYSHPARWKPMFKKQGALGVLLTASRFLSCIREGRLPDFITDKQLGIVAEQKRRVRNATDLTAKVEAKLEYHGISRNQQSYVERNATDLTAKVEAKLEYH